MSSFDIINIHLITLENPLVELIHRICYLIYYVIETYIYKHRVGSVSFQYGMKIFYFIIHLQTTPTVHTS